MTESAYGLLRSTESSEVMLLCFLAYFPSTTADSGVQTTHCSVSASIYLVQPTESWCRLRLPEFFLPQSQFQSRSVLSSLLRYPCRDVGSNSVHAVDLGLLLRLRCLQVLLVAVPLSLGSNVDGRLLSFSHSVKLELFLLCHSLVPLIAILAAPQ